MIKSDLYRLKARWSVGLALKALIADRTFRPIITLRLCQTTRGLGGPLGRSVHLLARLLHRCACGLATIDLPWEASIQPGLAITHGWGLVVAPGAKIGRNVTMFHGVTLGRRDRIHADGSREIGYPTIEDDVWIGPHAIIVGDVVIGRGSRIAGGAFVTESVPARSLVVGNPAKIAKTDCMPDVPNRVPDEITGAR